MTPRPFVPLSAGAQVELIYDLFGQPCSNRLWFVYTGFDPFTAALEFLIFGIGEYWRYIVMPCLSVDLTMEKVRVTDWRAPGGEVVEQIYPSVPGGNSSRAHSANVALLIRIISAQAPPRIYNYNFLPGIPVDEVDENVYSDALRDCLHDAYSGIFDALRIYQWTWVCTSQELNGVPRATQRALRADFIYLPSRYVTTRRKRLSAAYFP